MSLTSARTALRSSYDAADPQLRFEPPRLLLDALGVDFHAEPDSYYIETRIGFDRQGLEMALAITDLLGLEVMDRHECFPDILEGGRARIYLADATLAAA